MKAVTNRKGFTLVELLVVISIIAMLLAILLPSLSKARDLAKRMVCMTRQRSIGLSMLAYSQAYNGKLLTRYPDKAKTDYWKNSVPYSWPQKGCIDIMKSYIGLTDVFDCPLSQYKAYYIDPVKNPGNEHAGDWNVNMLWLSGLGEYGKYSRYIFDDSAAPSDFSKAKSRQIILTDRNNYMIGDPWGGWSNHSGGHVPVRTLQEFLKKLKGSNRIYADGHGETVKPDRMGKNDMKPTDKVEGSRYSHNNMSSRPYYW
jgi:prepilin-type N-terminal cleavage/methylation domain-containing protein